MSHPTDQLKPGMVVEITQQIPQRDEVWTTATRGTIVNCGQVKTGSWYAHARHDKLWLDRLTIRKDDGEIADLILDEYTHVEVIDESGLCDAT